MKKIIAMIFLFMIISPPALSEVIKCKLASGKVVYQSTPCSSSAISHGKVDIQPLDPIKDEEARRKLKAWQAEQAANEAAKIKASKELQEELDRQETINALNRNAIAQQQQAIAAQRQAEALERRNNAFIYNSPYFYAPQFNGIPYGTYPSHEHHERHHEDNHQGIPLNSGGKNWFNPASGQPSQGNPGAARLAPAPDPKK
jgi:hypothetical protein